VEDSFITELEEKPKRHRTNLAITGLYAFPPEFFDAICRTPPSDRGELEITDSIANFLGNPAGVRAEVWEGGWADAGQHHTFLEASRQVLDWAEDLENAGVVEDSVLNGKVGTGDGTTITGSRLDGPVLLGEGCRIVNSCIGPYVSVGNRSVIENSNVRNTVIDADVLVADLKRGLDGSIVGVRSKLIGNGRGGPPVRQLVGDDTQLRLDQAEPQVSP
jgi:glucose-1-phosphate thymidylyltransferase